MKKTQATIEFKFKKNLKTIGRTDLFDVIYHAIKHDAITQKKTLAFGNKFEYMFIQSVTNQAENNIPKNGDIYSLDDVKKGDVIKFINIDPHSNRYRYTYTLYSLVESITKTKIKFRLFKSENYLNRYVELKKNFTKIKKFNKTQYDLLSKHFELSEEFMCNHISNFNYHSLIINQTLCMDFISKYFDRDNTEFDLLVKHQHLTDEFITCNVDIAKQSTLQYIATNYLLSDSLESSIIKHLDIDLLFEKNKFNYHNKNVDYILNKYAHNLYIDKLTNQLNEKTA